MRFSCTPAIEIERNILSVLRQGIFASYLIYVHTYARAAVRLSACTSARTRRRTTGVAGFRQSNDNDRNVEGNRLHAVKMRRATRNIARRGVGLMPPENGRDASFSAARLWDPSTLGSGAVLSSKKKPFPPFLPFVTFLATSLHDFHFLLVKCLFLQIDRTEFDFTDRDETSFF